MKDIRLKKTDIKTTKSGSLRKGRQKKDPILPTKKGIRVDSRDMLHRYYRTAKLE